MPQNILDPVFKARQKKSRLIIGLMSGTSADGIDACLCKIQGVGETTRAEILHLTSVQYPSSVETLLTSEISNLNIEQIARLNFFIGKIFAEAAVKCILAAGYNASQIDAIASHGQTLVHLPTADASDPILVPATLQVGDISVIAQRTGILTIGDFRPADMAQGGQGAPLVPYADFLLFRDPKIGRIIQNIGGIANLTYLPPNCTQKDVIAFDTGPGNMVIDAVVNMLTQGKYSMDTDGGFATSGNVNQKLLSHLLNDPYFAIKPPKTTGREMFGVKYARQILNIYEDYTDALLIPKDRRKHICSLVATVSELTVRTIIESYKSWILPKGPIHEVILGGGGAQNPYLCERLNSGLQKIDPNIRVLTHENFGIPNKAKECLAFAVLGNNFLGHVPNNMPSATGAEKAVVMGKLALP